MKARLYPRQLCDDLRGVGDPPLERAPELNNLQRSEYQKYFECVASKGVTGVYDHPDDRWKQRIKLVTAVVLEDRQAWLTRLDAHYGISSSDVHENVWRARSLFAQHGEEICAALLLAALPEMYATAWGARVLVANGQLVWHLRRRIRQTAVFLMTILSEEERDSTVEQLGLGDIEVVRLDPSKLFERATETLVAECAALRLFHHVLRSQLKSELAAEVGEKVEDQTLTALLGPENKVPLNLEDLVGTLLTFSVTTFRVLDQFGVAWTADDQDSYLMFWDLVGALLGIDDQALLTSVQEKHHLVGWITLRPPTVDDAAALLDQLHQRQWLPVQFQINTSTGFQWDALVPGRQLVGALQQAMTAAMPPLRKGWPASVMRQLAPPQVRARLDLNRTGLAGYVFDQLPDRMTSIPPFTGYRARNRTRALVLRAMAIEVAGRAILSFLQSGDPPVVIAGVPTGGLNDSSNSPTLGWKTKADHELSQFENAVDQSETGLLRMLLELFRRSTSDR
jgi:hypothetical protein